MIEKINPQRELFRNAENYALQFLKQGREDWDIPHTLAVVHFAELISEAENQDTPVIVSAAYLHDIGYYDLFSGDSKIYEAVEDKKNFTHVEWC